LFAVDHNETFTFIILLIVGLFVVSTRFIIREIDKDGIHPETHLFCSTSLSQMANEITENKELWDEFRHELQKRKVVTSLATKEVLYEFSKERMNRIEKQTSSIDTNVYDNAFNSNMHNFMEKHSKVRHKLHNSKIFDK